MTSTSPQLYFTRIHHARKAPVRHVFDYRGYSWFFDLDDPPHLPVPLRPFGYFRAEDHLRGPGTTLRARVEEVLAEHGIDCSGGPITALMNARVLGYVFDPLTVGAAAAAEPLPRMIIRDPAAFFARLGGQGLIGFGESYTAGEWTAPDPAAVLTVLAVRLTWLVPAVLQRFRWVLPAPPAGEIGTAANARGNVEHHYDLSNDLFRLFLDESMSYSCAVFEDPDTACWDLLAAAQRRKIDRLLDAAGVRAGTRLLEIGTGWGEL